MADLCIRFDHPNIKNAFAEYKFDFIDFSGSYTQSTGIELIRQDIAKYIERRDGSPSNASDIYVTAGASVGVKVQ